MKKIFVCMFLFALIMVSGCSSEVKAEPIAVKNGFIDISVEQLENDFNAQLSEEYIKAHLSKGGADDKHSYYSCNLGTGISLSVLATPDATMTYIADLSLDMAAENKSGNNLGYYFAKLIYTVAPDITGEEIKNISTEIDMANPYPGVRNVTERNNIVYCMSVGDDDIVHLAVMAYQTT